MYKSKKEKRIKRKKKTDPRKMLKVQLAQPMELMIIWAEFEAMG